jgi:hypothetical protein
MKQVDFYYDSASTSSRRYAGQWRPRRWECEPMRTELQGCTGVCD